MTAALPVTLDELVALVDQRIRIAVIEQRRKSLDLYRKGRDDASAASLTSFDSAYGAAHKKAQAALLDRVGEIARDTQNRLYAAQAGLDGDECLPRQAGDVEVLRDQRQQDEGALGVDLAADASQLGLESVEELSGDGPREPSEVHVDDVSHDLAPSSLAGRSSVGDSPARGRVPRAGDDTTGGAS